MYKLNEEKMFFDVADGQAVVINIVTGMYYGTNALGSVVLERLVKGNAPEEIEKAVKDLDNCPADINNKLAAFIDKLIDAEILVSGETVPGGSEAIDQSVVEEGFDLTLDEFAEVQDLLLADPIHDVDVEQGWPIFKEDEKEEE